MSNRFNTTDNRYLDATRSSQGDRTHAHKFGAGTGTALCGVKTAGRIMAEKPLEHVTCQKCRKAMGTDIMAAAQMVADKLRSRYVFTGANADLNTPDWMQWLNEISVWEDWNGAPAVIWETDQEWAFAPGWMDYLRRQGSSFYQEPYYSFAVNIYEA
jgi:hypothetical protein